MVNAGSATTPPLLTVPVVAAQLGISRQRAYALIAEGVIPATRITRRSIRVPTKAFEAWLEVQNERAARSLTTAAALVPNDEGPAEDGPLGKVNRVDARHPELPAE